VSFLKLCEICDQVALLLKGLSKPEVELIVRCLRVLVREYLDAFKLRMGKQKYGSNTTSYCICLNTSGNIYECSIVGF